MIAAEEWTDQRRTAWEAVRSRIAHAVPVYHAKKGYRVLMLTNASDFFWGGCVTQVPEKEVWSEMQVVEQSHEPHGFVRGAFRHQNIPISQVVAQRLQGRSAYLGKFECMLGLPRRMKNI